MDVKKIRDKLDIVDYIGRYADLQTRNGVEFFCSCPFHRDDNPSFFVNREKQLWRCFSCNSSGDILSFIQKYHNVSFTEAVQILQMEIGCEIIETPMFIKVSNNFKKKDVDFLNRVFLLDNCMDEFPANHNIKEWLEEGISLDILKKYNVRYDYANNIVFPIYDENNKIVSIKKRNIRKVPKYIYMTKFGRKDFLFNLNFSKKYIEEKNECIIVESEKSVMKLATWGIFNSVAVGSHNMNIYEQNLVCMMNCENIVFAYDQDVERREIIEQVNLIKHYHSVWCIPTNHLPAKFSPVDIGFEGWCKLYGERKRIV